MELELRRSPQARQTLFATLESARDVADLLEVDYATLVYHAYRMPAANRYKKFSLPKRKGGFRTISSPITHLKILQQKLAVVLSDIYEPRVCTHGFVHGRSVVTSAREHVGREWVLNIDLKDFFPAINFGRVRGLLMAAPYDVDKSAATVMAQIACHDDELPQGAPCSPVLSNMICAKLDRELMALAAELRCRYTRYADDLTFSTYRATFPRGLASPVSVGMDTRHGPGEAVERVINNNGFEVNYQKVRLQHRSERQQVTGLVVNRRVNVPRAFVRRIRAMIHAWRRYGLKAAEQEFRAKWDTRTRNPEFGDVVFPDVIRGKLGFLRMVRGHDDPIAGKLLAEVQELEVRDGVVRS